ncbi:hypothetical protein B0H10DRAFT_2356168 [Mycena sp. CBHHK59/15]|nr:hypothetical protein B0H10DRAFT_2356168 [Mycena sp. CBHHK59/15]
MLFLGWNLPWPLVVHLSLVVLFGLDSRASAELDQGVEGTLPRLRVGRIELPREPPLRLSEVEIRERAAVFQGPNSGPYVKHSQLYCIAVFSWWHGAGSQRKFFGQNLELDSIRDFGHTAQTENKVANNTQACIVVRRAMRCFVLRAIHMLAMETILQTINIDLQSAIRLSGRQIEAELANLRTEPAQEERREMIITDAH